MDDLLSLLGELREEVENLRNIRESEMEIDWYDNTPASLRQEKSPAGNQDEGSPVCGRPDKG